MLQARLKEGDREALAEAYKLYFERVYALAYKYTCSESISSDVVQDVFIKLWSNRSKISLELPLEQQVFVISKNILFDHFRKRSREEKLLQSYDEGILSLTERGDEEIREKRLQKVYDALNKLPQRQKEILELSRFQGLTYEEIASKLHLSPHTVSSHLSAALKNLKKQLSLLFF